MQPLSQTVLFCLLLLSCLTAGDGHVKAAPTASSKRAASTGGLSFRLIHRDSVHSPLYPGNLTTYELLQRQVNYAKARMQRMHSRAGPGGSGVVVPEDLTPIVTHVDGSFEYMVETYVGSKEVFQYLMIDTGSDLVWIQCEPYQGPHFDQDPPHYYIGNSTSLSFVPCADKVMCLSHYACEPTGKLCLVMESYGDDSWIKGFLSREHFGFENDIGEITTIANVTFACVFTAREQMFASSKIAGIFGMGRGHQSLATQLAYDRGQGTQFTYCFVPSPAETVSYLRFGQNFAINDTNPKTLRFVWNPRYTSYYYLNLTGLSCYVDELKMSRSTFAIGRDGSGGCFIDTGSMMSFLIKPAYDVLKAYILNYFKGSNVERVKGPLDLCFRLLTGLQRPLPSMDYHFGEEGHMRVHPNKLWMRYMIQGDEYVCLGVLPEAQHTVIGANHQTNMRFVYDVLRDTLSFGNEDCANDE